MKRILSFLMAISLLFILSFSTFATTINSDIVEQVLKDEIEKLNESDVITINVSFICNKEIYDMPSWPDIKESRAELKQYNTELVNNCLNLMSDVNVIEITQTF